MNPTDKQSAQAAALRRQAEALLPAHSVQCPADLAALSPEEIWRIMDDLRVHQIELELQNEELRRTQEQLETSNARYFDLYEMAPVAYCTINAEGIIQEANHAVSTLLGVDRGALINQPLSRFLFSDDQDILYLLRKNLFFNGEPQKCELRMVLPGGTLCWVRLDAVLKADADDTPQCRMVLTHMSEPKQYEQALRANEQRLRFLFQNASDIQVILNPDGSLRYLSPAAERITNFPLSSLEGLLFTTYIHPEDTQKVQAAWQEALAHPEKSVTVQFRHAHNSNGWVCLEVIAQSFVAEPSINGVIASVRDISERHALEQKWRQYERDLEAIFNATTESIHLLDAQGTVLMANEYTARRLGTTVEELIGRPIFDFFPPEVAARRKKWIEELKAAGQPGTTIDQRNGRFFETNLWPMKDADGSVNQIVIFSKEVTERLAAEQALTRSQTLLNATQRLARIGGWEWDVAQQSMTWTAETYRIHGFIPDDQPTNGAEHIRRSLSCYPPEDRALVAAAFRRCVESGEPYDLRVRFVSVDGRKLWVRTMAEPIWDNEKVILVRGTLMDVTQKVEQEQHLRIFHNIVASTTDSIAYLDRDYRYVLTNVAHEKFFGLGSGLIGMTVAESHGEKVFDKILKPLLDRCLQGEVINYRQWFSNSIFGRRYLDVSFFPYREEGNLITGIIAYTRDITEHLQTAKALRDSEERFRLIFDRSPAGTAIVGPDLRFQLANESLCRLLGYSEDELRGRTFADITRPEDRERDLALVRRLLAGEINNFEVEKQYLHKNGEAVWALVNVTLVRDANQRPLFLLPIVQDIRERKEAEKVLQESEGRFRQLLESLPAVAVQGYEPDGTVLYWNKASEQLYGFTAEEALGRNILDLIIPPEIRHEIQQAMDHMVKSGIPIPRTELSLLCRDGLRVTVDSSHLLLQGLDGGRQLYCVDIDLTEQRRMEIMLHEQAAFNRRILDSTAAHIAILDPDGIIIDVNTSWSRFAKDNKGIEFEKLGPGASYFCCWGPKYGDITNAEQAFAGIRQVQRGERDSFTIEYPCHSLEHKRWFSLQVLPLQGGEGQVLVSHTDVSALKLTEEHLLAALAEKEVLLREVHHRVKNNLAAIIGLLDMQRRMLEDSQGRQILTELSGRIRSMSLIHEKLYRADNLARINFQHYLTALISHLRTSFGSPRIQCRTEAPGVELPLDLAVPCGMIVNELMTNALKYAFPGGQPAPGKNSCLIQVRMHQENGLCTLTVADNGVGLPPGFDWTCATTLGMVLVRMLGRHQLGGTYTIDQQDGLCFTLTFSEQRGKQ